MTQVSPLLPLACPFCGCLTSILKTSAYTFMVGCNNTRACGVASGRLFDTEAEAIEAWNRRSLLPLDPEAVARVREALRAPNWWARLKREDVEALLGVPSPRKDEV